MCCSYVDEFVEWKPRGAVVRRHVDDVRLTVDVLTAIRQKPHADLRRTCRNISAFFFFSFLFLNHADFLY